MKREKIIQTAALLFVERGFAGTPTSLLAKRAGVAEGTIFRHFKSKDDILLTLIEEVRTQIIHDVENYLLMSAPHNGMEKVEAVLKAFCIFVQSNQPSFTLLFRDAPVRYENTAEGAPEKDEQVFKMVQSIHSFLADYLREAIHEGQLDGSIRPDTEAPETATVILCAIVGLARSIHFEFVQPTDILLRSIIDVFSASLRVRS